MAGSAAFEVAVWSKGASAAMAAPLDRGLGRLDLARVLVLLLAVRRWWAVLAAGWSLRPALSPLSHPQVDCRQPPVIPPVGTKLYRSRECNSGIAPPAPQRHVACRYKGSELLAVDIALVRICRDRNLLTSTTPVCAGFGRGMDHLCLQIGGRG
jgi:hypothetical protein